MSFVACDVEDDLLHRITLAQASFSKDGPTHQVLQNFDQIVNYIEGTKDKKSKSGREIQEQLPHLYFKKALIEINLHKENLAITDLKRCLELDPNMSPVRRKLKDMLLERGNFDELRALVTSGDEEEARIHELEQRLSTAENYYRTKKYDDCVSLVGNEILPYAPLWALAYEVQLKCSKLAFSASLNEDIGNIVIKDLQKLILIFPLRTDLYEEIASYVLFTGLDFERAWGYVRNCLKIDNENVKCGKLSKFFVKSQKILKILEDYSNYVDKVYHGDGGNTEDHDSDDMFDFGYVTHSLLQEEVKVSKSEKKGLPKFVRSNYDYLKHISAEFLKLHKLNRNKLHDLQFNNVLDKILCEAFAQTKQYQKGKPFCNNVKDESNGIFLPKMAAEIDSLLKQKKYGEARNLLKKFNPNVQRTALFKRFYSTIERRYRQQQQQQQQRHNQDHYQYQYHQYNQQNNQNQFNSPSTINNAKDYYKILGVLRDVDDKELKKAYRAQTLKYHPDKYKGSDLTSEQMEEKMQDINEAYEVLSSPESREMYDRGNNPNERMSGPGGGQSRPGANQGFRFNFDQNFMNNFMKDGTKQHSFNFGGFGSNGQRRKAKKFRKGP